jgi:xanthine dehydrogenase molybdenum-binding subunit
VKATLEAVRDAYRSARFAGIACGVKNTGVGNGLAEYGKAILRPEADGTVTLFHSWTEMGQGCHTALAQIACEELGVPFDRLRVVVDTERELGTGQTTASRSTVLGGRAVIEAAAGVKAALNGGRLEDLAGQEFYGEVVIDWTHKPGHGPEGAATHFAYGWATQVVILDGDGRIERVVAAHDVGRALNPTQVEGQIHGGIAQGIGLALMEEYHAGSTENLHDYLIPTIGDVPPIEVILVEDCEPLGPHGAKGVGEPALIPTAPAIFNAIHHATGVRLHHAPATPDRVRAALLAAQA